MVRRTTFFISLVFVLLVSGCVVQPITPEAPGDSTPTTTTEESTPSSSVDSSAFSVEILKNLAYQLEVVPSGSAQLTEGRYEDAANRIQVYWFDTYAMGELDGEPAAAVVINANTGGSGTFSTLAVVMEQEGEPVNVASAVIGDRVRLNRISITDNEIVLDLVTQGENEGMCCGSQRMLVNFALENDELVATSGEIIGEQPQLSETQVITYVPEIVPDVTEIGSCFTNAIGLGRADAWRCATDDNQLHDPCFQVDDAPTVVCGVDPIRGESGFVLELTEPLPAAEPGQQSMPWLVQLSDGTVCGLMGGTIPGGADWIAPYGCADQAQSYLIDEFNTEFPVWFAQSVVVDLGEDGFVIKSSALAPIATVWK
jgi:hypothetical protein